MNRSLNVCLLATLFYASPSQGACASCRLDMATIVVPARLIGAHGRPCYSDLDSTSLADSTTKRFNQDSLIRRRITLELALGGHSRASHSPQGPPTFLLGITVERWSRVQVGGRLYSSAVVGMAREVFIETDTGYIDTPYGDRWDLFAVAKVEVIPLLNFNLSSGLGISMIRLVHVGDYERLKTWGVSPAAFVGASLDLPPIFLGWALSASTADVSSFTGAEGSTVLHYFLVGVRLDVN